MPLYDYKCAQCGKIVEVRHGFDESHDGSCPACGSPLQRVFNPAPIVFKGSGFYVTDTRKSQATGAPAKAEAATPSESAAKSESKPAADAKPSSESKSAPASEPAA
jgi:putative FmdB family regulatory protein